MITAFRKLLSWRREPESTLASEPRRADAELRVLAVEALDRWLEALRASPKVIGGADAAAIVREIYTRESLTEAEFFVMADHFDVATAQFMDGYWADRLRVAIPAGRA